MKYYDSIAGGYDTLHGQEQWRKLDLIARHIPFTPRGQVLDVGCGTGISTDFWADRYNCETTGIDPSAKLIEENDEDYSTFVVGYAEQLPFDDGEFDLVVSITAIQNFADIAKGLQEIKRVGKGNFILSWLKSTQKDEKVKQQIKSNFGNPTLILEDRHDTIWIYNENI